MMQQSTAYSICEALANTPWWVYLFFGYLVWTGYLATKSSTSPFKNMFIVPIVFISFSILDLYHLMEWNLNHLLTWFGALFAGMLIGWVQFFILRIKAIKNSDQIYVPGSYFLLLVIFGLITLKYYLGYEIVLDADVFFNHKQYSDKLLILYGLLAGLFFGRVLYVIKCRKWGPYATEGSG